MQSVGDAREQIYHTDVMMCVGTGWATVCLDSVDHLIQNSFAELLKKMVSRLSLFLKQISRFAGNISRF